MISFDPLKAKLAWMMITEWIVAILQDKLAYFEKG